MEQSRKDLTHRAVDLMIHTDRHHRILCDQRFSALGVHRSQHKMLMYLHKKGGVGSQRRISQDMQISTAVVTVTLQKLEAEGYVTRTVSDTDKRNVAIALTDRGNAVVEDTCRIIDEIDARMFDGMSEAEIEQYIALTARIFDNSRALLREECK